jgi:hypothetical protein
LIKKLGKKEEEKGGERVRVPDDGRRRGNDRENYWRKWSPLLAIRKRGGGLLGTGRRRKKLPGLRKKEKSGKKLSNSSARRAGTTKGWAGCWLSAVAEEREEG